MYVDLVVVVRTQLILTAFTNDLLAGIWELAGRQEASGVGVPEPEEFLATGTDRVWWRQQARTRFGHDQNSDDFVSTPVQIESLCNSGPSGRLG